MNRIFTLGLFMVCVLSISAQNQKTNTTRSAKDTVTLREIIVKSSKPITRLEGDGIVTTVNGTPLQDLGTAKDVLGFIPGISNDNGSIEVIGKGSPTIYVNGRIVRNLIELDQLKSHRIKEIKLIANPGARYGSSINAVIRISTLRDYGEGFALDTKTTVGYRDYIYGKEEIGMNYRNRNLDVFCMLEYDNTRSKGSSTNIQDTWTNPHFNTELKIDSKMKSQLYDGKLGFNYSPSPKHSFGAYYQMTYKPSDRNMLNTSALFADDVLQETGILSQRRDDDYHQHLADAYYSGIWGKWSADFTFDILWRKNKETQNIREKSPIPEAMPSVFYEKSHGRMIAAEGHISRPVWKGSLSLGSEFTDSRRKEDFTNSESIIENSDNLTKEWNIGVYAELTQRFGPLMAKVGLRYEHINSDYYEYGTKMQEQSRRYDELLPSASLSMAVRKCMFQLSYSRKYRRPLYSQLSSAVIYVNPYLYESGNPFLRSSFSDNLALNFRFGWLMVMAGYKHVDDQVITSCIQYGNNPEITLLKKANSRYGLDQIQTMVSVMPGMIGKIWYPVLSGGVVSQFYRIDYRNSVMDLNRPMFVVRFQNMLRLPHNYTVTAGLSWRSKGDGENIRMGQTWQVNLSAAKVFNNHWDLKLSLNDIFNTGGKSTMTIYSGNREIHTEKRINTRQIELSIGYKFNTTKSKYKGKGAGNGEKERL